MSWYDDLVGKVKQVSTGGGGGGNFDFLGGFPFAEPISTGAIRGQLNSGDPWGGAKKGLLQATTLGLSSLIPGAEGALLEGKGTPWGAPESGAPSAAEYEAQTRALQNFNMDPNNYAGFNSSDLRRSMEQNLARKTAQQRAQAQGRFSKMGVQGADAARAQSALDYQQQAATNDINAQLAMQDYNTRVANMMAAYDKQKSALAAALEKYNTDIKRKALEDQARRQGVQDVLGAWGDFNKGTGEIAGSALKFLA